jgi:tetratricopeptide (TPR) repeat protein
MSKGDYVGTEKHFLKALSLYPSYATLHINLGVLNEATGKPDQAEHFFKKAIALQPGQPSGYYYYARFLKKQKRIPEAIEYLNKTLKLASAHMDAHHLLMTIYQEGNDFHKAAESARRTLAIASDDEQALKVMKLGGSGAAKPGVGQPEETPEYYLNLSLAHYRAKDFVRSLEAAQKALQLRPGYDLAYNNICAAYNELKQWDKAIEAGRRAVALNPGNALARNNLAWAEQQKLLGSK